MGCLKYTQSNLHYNKYYINMNIRKSYKKIELLKQYKNIHINYILIA